MRWVRGVVAPIDANQVAFDGRMSLVSAVRHHLGRRRSSSLLTAVALILAGCAIAGQPASGSAWSIRAMNSSLVDFVLRYSSGEATKLVLLPPGADGLVDVRGSPPEAAARIAVLDPVSCRPLAELDAAGRGHHSVDVYMDGSLDDGPYDPSDYDNPFGLAARLTTTDRCATADPAVTPRPLPSLRAGVWLEGSAISCEATVDGATFGVRGEFVLGAIDGCEIVAKVDPAHIPPDTASVVLWDPMGDGTSLGVAWLERACASEATVSLHPGFDGYELDVIAISTPCEGPFKPHAVVFSLTDALESRSIVGTVEHASR